MKRPALILYGRAGCHLCTDMLAELQPHLERHGIRLHTRDVDADPELAQRYGLRVPVLALGEQEICQYFLDPQALERTLKRNSA